MKKGLYNGLKNNLNYWWKNVAYIFCLRFYIKADHNSFISIVSTICDVGLDVKLGTPIGFKWCLKNLLSYKNDTHFVGIYWDYQFYTEFEANWRINSLDYNGIFIKVGVFGLAIIVRAPPPCVKT